jgi:hypothetical protein
MDKSLSKQGSTESVRLVMAFLENVPKLCLTRIIRECAASGGWRHKVAVKMLVAL